MPPIQLDEECSARIYLCDLLVCNQIWSNWRIKFKLEILLSILCVISILGSGKCASLFWHGMPKHWQYLFWNVESEWSNSLFLCCTPFEPESGTSTSSAVCNLCYKTKFKIVLFLPVFLNRIFSITSIDFRNRVLKMLSL